VKKPRPTKQLVTNLILHFSQKKKNIFGDKKALTLIKDFSKFSDFNENIGINS